MVDCLKRRDIQIENKWRNFSPLKSIPILSSQIPMCSQSSSKAHEQSSQVRPIHMPMSVSGSTSIIPSIKLEFPSFNSNEDDPVMYVERSEGYLAIRRLSDCVVLASTISVLKNPVVGESRHTNSERFRGIKKVLE